MTDIVKGLTVGGSYVFNIRHPEHAGSTRNILRVYCGHVAHNHSKSQTVVLKDSLGYYSHICINHITQVLEYGL